MTDLATALEEYHKTHKRYPEEIIVAQNVMVDLKESIESATKNLGNAGMEYCGIKIQANPMMPEGYVFLVPPKFNPRSDMKLEAIGNGFEEYVKREAEKLKE